MSILQFSSVSKRYRIQNEIAPTDGSARWYNRFRRQPKEFLALDNVSFSVEQGEALGIIGHNGAGKSTALKLLARIITPTSGEISYRGRLAALIEVGSGFHPELTGRENIYLSGSILGMSRREITNKLESIIEFSEVSRFIDMPVKRYSSGMYVRLGFSIAAHLEPDILLLDEVLAVGDAAFQDKCKQRFRELRAAGTTIVFISHDLTAVQQLCSRAILLQKGAVQAEGTPTDVINAYNHLGKTQQTDSKHAVSGKARVEGIVFLDEQGQETTQVRSGDPLSVRLDLLVHEAVQNAQFDVYFNNMERRCLTQLSTGMCEQRIDLQPGRVSLLYTCPSFSVPSSLYTVDAVIEETGVGSVEWLSQCGVIHVLEEPRWSSESIQPFRWELAPERGDVVRGLSHPGR